MNKPEELIYFYVDEYKQFRMQMRKYKEKYFVIHHNVVFGRWNDLTYDPIHINLDMFQSPSRAYDLEKVYNIRYNNVSENEHRIINYFPNIDIDLFTKMFNKKYNTNIKPWKGQNASI